MAQVIHKKDQLLSRKSAQREESCDVEFSSHSPSFRKESIRSKLPDVSSWEGQVPEGVLGHIDSTVSKGYQVQGVKDLGVKRAELEGRPHQSHTNERAVTGSTYVTFVMCHVSSTHVTYRNSINLHNRYYYFQL